MPPLPERPWEGAARRLSQVWRSPGVRLAVTIVVVERLVLGLIGWLAAAPVHSNPGEPFLDSLAQPPGSLAGALIGPWQRADGLWYQWIATVGYGQHPAEAAFFPFYPTAVHGVGSLLGGAVDLAALLVSTMAFTAALILLHRLVSADLGPAVARRSVLLLACAPFALFFLGPFSEALFLLVAVGCVLAARRRRFLVSGICAALAAWCRLQGVLLLVPLLVELIATWRERRSSSSARRWTAVIGSDEVLALLLPVAALALNLQFLSSKAGPYRSFAAIESNFWGVHLSPPWAVLWDSLSAIATGRHPEEAGNLLVCVVLLAAIPLMWRRLPLSYTLLAVALAAPSWFHQNWYSPLMSAGRFGAVIFPLFVLMALLLDRRGREIAVVSVFAALLAFTFWRFTEYNFIG